MDQVQTAPRRNQVLQVHSVALVSAVGFDTVTGPVVDDTHQEHTTDQEPVAALVLPHVRQNVVDERVLGEYAVHVRDVRIDEVPQTTGKVALAHIVSLSLAEQHDALHVQGMGYGLVLAQPLALALVGLLVLSRVGLRFVKRRPENLRIVVELIRLENLATRGQRVLFHRVAKPDHKVVILELSGAG